MPQQRALKVTISVGPADGSGGPDRSLSFTVPVDGSAGLSGLTAAQGQKLGDRVKQLAALADEQASAL